MQHWYKKNSPDALSDFFDFLSIPSVSTDPSCKEDVLACARWVKKYLEDSDLKVELWETSGYPIVFGTDLRAGSGKPTLLIYLHYDVQPPDPLDEWLSPPFEPEVREGKVYARGAVDNKGQCFYTMLAIGFNLKVLIEGEEEVGSGGLTELLKTKRAELQADHVVIIDVGMIGEGRPAVTVGLRGITTMELKCRVASADLHSGIYGGIVMNPARALAHALDKCWDESGSVAIPGFYDGVTDKKSEKLAWDTDVRKWGEPFGVSAFNKEEGYSLIESNWIRPTLEINGMGSGYQGEGSKSIIPATSFVKLSCRLVPGQDPKRIQTLVLTFLRNNLPRGIEVELERGEGASGFITSVDSPTFELIAGVYAEVFKAPCPAIMCGATLPIARLLAEASGGDVVATGVALPEDGMHAPNESIALDRFEQGFHAVVELFRRLG